MSMSNASETALLELLFKNTAWANVGNAGGLQPSGVAGNLYVALHTADPAEAGDQSTNEISYTGYARVAVARSGAGWTVSGNQVSNAATVQFGEMTAGAGGSATYFSVGLESAGATAILFSGQLTAPRSISNGITPLFNAGALTGTVD
jgi:hypothetical protein